MRTTPALRAITAAIAMGFCTMAVAEDAKFDAARGAIEAGTAAPAYSLRIAFPDGRLTEREILAGETIAIEPKSPGGTLAEGLYKYELRPILGFAQRGDNEAVETPKAEPVASQSGTFRVRQGLFFAGDAQDTEEKAVVAGSDLDYGVRMKDQVILDDLIVDGSACIGQDCVNGESFGFDTLRLKENNLRIKFQDTSNSASFPTNDWQITINDSTNGGANKFSIDDIDGARTPFTIEAGARTNSLYVENDGDVGFGTANPVVNLHAVDGNTPTLRLEQDGSSGFTPQTWDVAGNEANFFIRDATNGSKLPFKIKPGAPDNALFIASTGRVGLGTTSPSGGLHVRSTQIPQTVIENPSGNTRMDIVRPGSINVGQILFATGSTFDYQIGELSTDVLEIRSFSAAKGLAVNAAGNIGIGTLNPTVSLDVVGDIAASGMVTQGSDVRTKNNIERVDGASVLNKLMRLPIFSWSYKWDANGERHVGPMAQDFYSAFGLGGSDTRIAPLDVSGLAIAAVQELNAELDKKEKRISDLEAQIAELRALILEAAR
ncbi:tail fiber domain-containing protein [Pseudomarimonas salicorniae]|uniref:Tail fiber domain-containing protein n=1 Tax=Pseudomarimonas salicorniae TaxID=2933270 RepID=A0ABT0GIV3_9GAMM|nr:tail fiber domain-containing protein [Lysobacter sp. CAU 1642]MCK7594472.1 tail fiber domain-containing protein [Lysobacter sp. CAU 1642]